MTVLNAILNSAASYFVMTPPPATFWFQVDLRAANQSYLHQISHIKDMWQCWGLELITTVVITLF